MKLRIALVLTMIAVAGVSSQLQAVTPKPEELVAAKNWAQKSFGPDATNPPFSFMYGGKSSAELLKTCKVERSSKRLDGNRTQQTIVYTDPKTGLEVRCVEVEYNDFPTLEWTVYLKNNGSGDSPFLDGVKGLNVGFEREAGSEFVLRHNAGSWPGGASYALYETPLTWGALRRISAYGGRPSNTDMPYFNLGWNKEGVIIAVGWPGQWDASFHRDDRLGITVQSGQELTHLRLHPGEEIRTPLIVLQFWNGDWVDAQNVWRRWMIKHNLPKPGGKPLAPIFSGQTGYCTSWMYEATEANQKEFIDRFQEIGIKLDAWWMDTGWFYVQGVPENQMTDEMKDLNKNDRLWEKFGIWEVNHVRFPNGIKAVSDYAHSKGIKTILWFEPERVTPGSWHEKAHPEWCLSASTTDQKLLNLGNPEALKWACDRISQVLAEQGIDVYRSDFNMDPLDHWRQNDAPDRQGITENHWVAGYLAFWDKLLERNPNLLIDSCASGGRRNDLETMRRSVPLWKSDYAIEPVGMQGQTYGLSMWIPYFGNAGGQMDPYVFRSNMFSAITKGAWEDRTPGNDIRDKKQDYNQLLRMIGQWRQVAPDYLGDYYPLTNYSLSKDAWMAWQFDRPEAGEGMVQAFRRAECNVDSIIVKLRGLDPAAQYHLTNVDENKPRVVSGRDLMEKGLRIKASAKPAALIIVYSKMQG